MAGNYNRYSLSQLKDVESNNVKKSINKSKNFISIGKKVFVYAKPYIHFFYLTILFDLINSIAELFIPIFIGKAINCAIGAGMVDFNMMTTYVIYLALSVVIAALFNYFGNLTITAFNLKTTYRIRALLFEKLNKLPISFIDSSSHGDLLSRMVNDTDTMTDGFLESFTTVLSGITSIIGTIVAMFILNIKLALVIVIMTPLSIFITAFILKKSRKYVTEEVRKKGNLSGYIEEYIGGQRVIKAFSYEHENTDSFKHINQDYYNTSVKSEYYGNIPHPTTRFINGLTYGAVGMFGSILALSGEITIGVISSFLSYANSFGKPFNDISSNISIIQSAFAAANRVFNILDQSNEISDANLPDLLECNGEISIKNVDFSYTPKTKLIQNFNLEVKQGQKIAIVGPTGCGKSTLINLLMRFYDVNNGSISVSGSNIREITRSSLRSKYGMVLQETWVFNATIRENIAYGNPNAPIEDIIEASKLAGLHDYIMKLPKGYDTVLDEGGSNISQGEKQLLCIARIFLLKPPMLILDEATSNIDTRTEKSIQNAFDEIMKGRTSFIVAHRLSTIKNADVILVMNKGNIIEKGTHDELMAKNGFYANLYNSQFVKV